VIGQVAFGRYRSPEYLIHPGEFIPSVGTRTGTPKVQAMNDVYFTLYLPSGTPPVAGWPVVICIHGANGSKENGSVTNMVASFAAHGMATIAINNVGHGEGPLSTLTVRTNNGATVTFSEGGRSEEHTSELQSRRDLVCRLLLEKKNNKKNH